MLPCGLGHVFSGPPIRGLVLSVSERGSLSTGKPPKQPSVGATITLFVKHPYSPGTSSCLGPFGLGWDL